MHADRADRARFLYGATPQGVHKKAPTGEVGALEWGNFTVLFFLIESLECIGHRGLRVLADA